eukprot:767085-Hanusia_phi.AAC.2
MLRLLLEHPPAEHAEVEGEGLGRDLGGAEEADVGSDLHLRAAGEGAGERQELVEHAPCRPDVALPPVHPALEQLGAQEQPRTNLRPRVPPLLRQLLGDPEVPEPDVVGAVEEEVGGLDVSVDDSLLVEVPQRDHDLQEPLPDALLLDAGGGGAARAYELLQVPPLRVLRQDAHGPARVMRWGGGGKELGLDVAAEEAAFESCEEESGRKGRGREQRGREEEAGEERN